MYYKLPTSVDNLQFKKHIPIAHTNTNTNQDAKAKPIGLLSNV